MYTADSAALVEDSKSAVRKYRKVHVIGKFFKGHKGHHVREIVMDVKSISIVK